ncbi:MAG: TrkH family potassium uptake protein [Succinivibrio sp.]|jgi:trk system potassium uptake protein TrkH|nr:TrkH family potassium uptake protein [Succinivibrio sp.]
MVVNLRLVSGLLSPAVFWFGIITLIPAVYSVFTFSRGFLSFALCGVLAILLSGLLRRLGRGAQNQPSIRDLFVFTVMLWALTALLAAIPFRFALENVNASAAVFESASALSTTGATVLTGLDLLPRPILLWRSMLQFLGGIGFVVIAVAVLPNASAGGMNIFRTESSSFDGRTKITPHVKTMAAGFLAWYLLTLFLCAFLYVLGGFSPFIAVNAALCTVSTGGMMPIDSSMNGVSPFIQYTAMVFMFLGSCPFMLILGSLSGSLFGFFRDEQVRGFFFLCVLISLMVAISLVAADGYGLERALRTSFFNVIAILSSTGFNFEDFTRWNPFASIIFFIILGIGGCSGSTAGGIKIFRLQICFSMMKVQFLKTIHPHAVAEPRFNRRIIDSDTLRAVITYLVAYLLVTAVSATAASCFGLSIIDAFSGTVSCLSNIGPAVGQALNPSTTFAGLPSSLHLIFAFDMILGRLEILPVLLCLSRMFWKS